MIFENLEQPGQVLLMPRFSMVLALKVSTRRAAMVISSPVWGLGPFGRPSP